MRAFRNWLYVITFSLAARFATEDVRAVQREVLSRGFKAYEEARLVRVDMRADLRDKETP